MNHFDVIVFGGGPTGFPAAIQAARMGAKTLLIEKSGQLGGTTTLNRVAFPGIFHAWNRQVIAGIGWDVVRRTVELEGHELPDFADVHARHWRHQIRLCPVLMAALIDEDIRQSGCELLLHTLPAAIERDADQWRIQLCGKEGLFEVGAKWIIDGTGDANAAQMAGCPLKPKGDELQPGTMVFSFDGYDADDIDIEQLDADALQALAEGRLEHGDFGWSGESLRQLVNSRGKNAIHINDIDASDSVGKTEAEMKGRAAILRMYRFLKERPGFENLGISWCAPECGIRETNVIEGETTVTYDDYISGKHWPDAVSYSYYPIDLHTHHGLQYEKLAEGVVPTIPLSALVPRGVTQLLAAGRCASGDRLAHSAFRVQASCMGMGQAAGAVAALSADSGESDAQQVDFAQLRQALEAQGAIFPVEGETPGREIQQVKSAAEA